MFSPTKKLFCLFKTIGRDYLINLILLTFNLIKNIFFYDSYNRLHIKNSIYHNRNIVHIEGTLLKGDSIMNAIDEINRKDQVNLFFLFCNLTITSGLNACYLDLLIGLISSKK